MCIFLTYREEAIRQYQEERRKRREKEDVERERFRDEIRQKYGIARKAESFGSFDRTAATAAGASAQVNWASRVALSLGSNKDMHAPDFSGEVGLNLALGPVTSCCSCQTALWRPTCCWLG